MILKESHSKEWIEKIVKKHKTDNILTEKVIRALSLLEGLAKTDLNFCFKGGTACMLMFKSTKRMSIDIDIIVPDRTADIYDYLDQIYEECGFEGYEPKIRKAPSKIEKEHYELHYTSALTGKDAYILLDVLKEDIVYQNTIITPIESIFLKQDGEVLSVRTPDFNNILADKLTAFAPNTSGIPYYKRNDTMGMEIIKQLYDVGCLFDKADDLSVVSDVFHKFAKIELFYKGDIHTTEDILDDIYNTALTICSRANVDDNCHFDILSMGMVQVRSFIFSELYHLERSFTDAAKAIYLSASIRTGNKTLVKYDKNIDLKDLGVDIPMSTKLNKLKKNTPEAFFYIYQAYLLLKE